MDRVTASKYEIIDLHTKAVVGTYTNRKRARTRADNLDNDYGAYRYIVRPVWVEVTNG